VIIQDIKEIESKRNKTQRINNSSELNESSESNNLYNNILSHF